MVGTSMRNVRTAGLDDLLAPLDGELRAGRERLLDELLERGFTPASLREAHRQDRLAVLLLDEALHESAFLSARDVANACGLEVEDVLHASRLLGLEVVDADALAFDELSCDGFRTLLIARSYGLSQAGINELLTVLRQHMWQLAADMEVIVGNELGRPGDTEYELAHRYADAGKVLAPTAAPLVASAFTAHLRDRMRDIFVTPAEAEVGSLRAVADVAVAFVDIVGFTELGERVDAGELRSIAMLLAGLADAAIQPPVRLVRTIGDAILLMSRDPNSLLNTIVKITLAAGAERTMPRVHCGVAFGPAYLGGADVYGAPVNLASRLTDRAPAGKIWGADSVTPFGSDACEWIAQGRQSFKGFAEPIDVFELATIDAEDS